MSVKLSHDDEQRLRSLATSMAQGIREPKDILAELGFDEDDWRELERSRTFKRMLEAAQAEWNNAASTPKRVKLKAGVNIEMSLPQLYQDLNDTGQPLAARVRLLEAMTHLAGLPEQEVREHAPGAQFKLEIHLGNDRVDVVNLGISGQESISGSAAYAALPIEGAAIPTGPNRHESFKLADYSEE